MALTNAQLLADQAQVFKDFPCESITISGNTYQCLVMPQLVGNEYGEGGLVNTVNLRVAIERSAIDSAIPTRGDTVTFSSQTLRVGDVEKDDANSSIILTLEHPTLR